MLRFQVDFGCSCNTIHSIDLQQLLQATIEPFAVHPLDYSKTIIPTQGWTSLHCTHRGKSYELVALVIAAQKYYAPLLGLPDSLPMGILNYDVDTVQQLQTTSGITLLPLGEWAFNSLILICLKAWLTWVIPTRLNSRPQCKAHSSCAHRYAAPKISDSGQLVGVNEPSPGCPV